MPYSPQTWRDGQVGGTPINAAALTHIEAGIATADANASAAIRSGSAAGGDLAGTLPAPTVAKVNGVAVSGAPSSGQVLTASGSAAAAWASPVLLNPFAVYVAPRGGGLEDSAAITSAISTAVTNAQSRGDCYAEVIFAPGRYVCNAAPTTGGTTNGSAIIPLPVIPVANQKVTLALRCPGADATGLFHWQQTAHAQNNAASLTSTYAAGATVPTTGEVSVLGGPTPHYGYGEGAALFSNMLVVVEGISVQTPSDPQVCGIDLRGVAEAGIVNVGVLATATSTGAPVIPGTASWQFGLALPYVGNNANCTIAKYAAEGQFVGFYAYEHLQAGMVVCVNCFDGIVWGSNSSFPHASTISYACIENCTRIIAFGGTSTNKLDILCLDIEVGAAWVVQDPSNTAYGTIGISSNGNGGSGLNNILNSGTTGVNGGTNLRLVNLDQATGHVAAPAVPATTTALKNPFWRDAAVTIAGGTVTAIAVDGQALGVTSGTVFVPTGKTITLTYSVAPTWQWTVL